MLLDQWCALICCGHSVLFVCPSLCLFAIDTFHGYSSVSQQLEIVASLLTVKQVLLGKKNVQKDVSYFFGCSVDLLKCLKNVFVFSNKDFHTCNLTCSNFYILHTIHVLNNHSQDGLHRSAVWLGNCNKQHMQSNQLLAGFSSSKSICWAAEKNLLCYLHQLLHRPTHLYIKKLIAEVLVNLMRETQVILIPVEGFSLIIPVLTETHQCQISLGLAGYLSLTAHGMGLKQ